MDPDLNGLIDQYRLQLHEALQTVPAARIVEAARILLQVQCRQGQVFLLWPPEDGGQVMPELARTMESWPVAFRVVRLHGAPRQVVAWQNDWAYEDVYAEQMRGRIGTNDGLVTLSRRGDAASVARALQTARRAGAATIVIVGHDGGSAKDLADICLHVHSDHAEHVAEAQFVLVHTLGAVLRNLVGRASDVTSQPARP